MHLRHDVWPSDSMTLRSPTRSRTAAWRVLPLGQDAVFGGNLEREAPPKGNARTRPESLHGEGNARGPAHFGVQAPWRLLELYAFLRAGTRGRRATPGE